MNEELKNKLTDNITMDDALKIFDLTDSEINIEKINESYDKLIGDNHVDETMKKIYDNTKNYLLDKATEPIYAFKSNVNKMMINLSTYLKRLDELKTENQKMLDDLNQMNDFSSELIKEKAKIENDESLQNLKHKKIDLINSKASSQSELNETWTKMNNKGISGDDFNALKGNYHALDSKINDLNKQIRNLEEKIKLKENGSTTNEPENLFISKPQMIERKVIVEDPDKTIINNNVNDEYKPFNVAYNEINVEKTPEEKEFNEPIPTFNFDNENIKEETKTKNITEPTVENLDNEPVILDKIKNETPIELKPTGIQTTKAFVNNIKDNQNNYNFQKNTKKIIKTPSTFIDKLSLKINAAKTNKKIKELNALITEKYQTMYYDYYRITSLKKMISETLDKGNDAQAEVYQNLIDKLYFNKANMVDAIRKYEEQLSSYDNEKPGIKDKLVNQIILDLPSYDLDDFNANISEEESNKLNQELKSVEHDATKNNENIKAFDSFITQIQMVRNGSLELSNKELTKTL